MDTNSKRDREVGGGRGQGEVASSSSVLCLLCQENIKSREGNFGEAVAANVKTLFRFLKLDLRKIPLLGGGGGGSSQSSHHLRSGGLRGNYCCWTEEEVVKCSAICETCDLFLGTFGEKYKVFESIEPAWRRMMTCIRMLASQMKRTKTTPPGRDDDDDGLIKYYNLKTEILRKCNLLLKFDTDEEEEPPPPPPPRTPCAHHAEPQRNHTLQDAKQGQPSDDGEEKQSKALLDQMEQQVSNFSELDDQSAIKVGERNVVHQDSEHHHHHHHQGSEVQVDDDDDDELEEGEQVEVEVIPQDSGLDSTGTTLEMLLERDRRTTNNACGNETVAAHERRPWRPLISVRDNDGGGTQEVDQSKESNHLLNCNFSPSSSSSSMSSSPPINTLSSTITTHFTAKARFCSYCGVPFHRGPKSQEMKHVFCFHTAAHFQEVFGGFSQGQVDAVTADIIRNELLLTNNNANNNDPDERNIKSTRFQCSICRETGKAGDYKFHVIKEHLDVVRSRLKKGSSGTTTTGKLVATTGILLGQVEDDGHNLDENHGEEVEMEEDDTGNWNEQDNMDDNINESKLEPPLNLPDPLAESSSDGPLANDNDDVDEVQEIIGVSSSVASQVRQHQLYKADFMQNRASFRTSTARPRFTVPFLISQAIAESPRKQLKAIEIYNWVKSSFKCYQTNAKAAKILRGTISCTLSSNPCFERVNPSVKDGTWKVKRMEFYKPGRKWSRKPKPASPKRLYRRKDGPLNRRNRDDEFPTTSKGSWNNNITWRKKREYGAGDPGSGSTTTTTTSPLIVASVPKQKCPYCDKIIFGPTANLERHSMCLHTLQHLSSQSQLLRRPGTSQQDVNDAIGRVCSQHVTFLKRPKFRCSLCRGGIRTDFKHHLLKQHFSLILSQLEEGGSTSSTSGGIPPASNINNFDDSSLASSEQLMENIIKQERTTEEMDHGNSEQSAGENPEVETLSYPQQ